MSHENNRESCHPQNQGSSTEPKETGSSFKRDSQAGSGLQEDLLKRYVCVG